jgi:hypothetical protein
MRPGPDVAPEVDVTSASSRRTASRTDTVDEPDSFALDTISGIIRSRPSTGCSPVRYSSSTAGRNPTPEPSATSSRARRRGGGGRPRPGGRAGIHRGTGAPVIRSMAGTRWILSGGPNTPGGPSLVVPVAARQRRATLRMLSQHRNGQVVVDFGPGSVIIVGAHTVRS